MRTLQRAFDRELTPGERAAVVDGVEGRRRHEVYLRWDPVKRNACWETDHKELPVQVTPPRGQHPRKRSPSAGRLRRCPPSSGSAAAVAQAAIASRLRERDRREARLPRKSRSPTRTAAVPTKPMFLIMNNAMGGDGGGTVATSPQRMQVDYVRVRAI